MSTTCTRPAYSEPGSVKSPTFASPNVTVRSARTASGSARPESASTPVGRSTAMTFGGWGAASRSCSRRRIAANGPSIGRLRPVPRSASTTSSDDASASRRADVMSSLLASVTVTPSSVSAAIFGSAGSRGVRRYTETSASQSARWRAATRPSPPLLPGPTSTSTRRPATTPRASHASCATARPASSISASRDVPASTALASSARIPAAVTSFIAVPVLAATPRAARGARRGPSAVCRPCRRRRPSRGRRRA